MVAVEVPMVAVMPVPEEVVVKLFVPEKAPDADEQTACTRKL